MAWMTNFQINESTTVKCKTWSSRNGFLHTAELYQNGSRTHKAQVKYYNRTWEKYQYQTVIRNVLENAGIENAKALTENQPIIQSSSD